jgi:hypothetical protein
MASRQPPDMRLLPVSVENAIDLIPPAIISFLILQDALVALPPSSRLKGPLCLFRPLVYLREWIIWPFRDFMQMSDMAEYDARNPVVLISPQWKKWTCVCLSSLATVGWFSFGATSHHQHHPEVLLRPFDISRHTYSLLLGISWVCINVELSY